MLLLRAAPLLAPRESSAAIDGEYIVVFNKETSADEGESTTATAIIAISHIEGQLGLVTRWKLPVYHCMVQTIVSHYMVLTSSVYNDLLCTG